MTTLTNTEIIETLKTLDGWNLFENAIYKDFTFGDFKSTFSFMTRVAELAENLNHHPTWTNTYTHLRIELSTHDVNGLTGLDFKLAKQIDILYHGL